MLSNELLGNITTKCGLYFVFLYFVLDIDSAKVDLSRTIELNPLNARLECDVPGRGLTYLWTCNGCGATDTSRTLQLPKSYSSANGKREFITCTASVGCEYCDNIESIILYSTLISHKYFLPILILIYQNAMCEAFCHSNK